MMLGGGIVVVLSLFLPRFTVTSAAGTTSVSGLSHGRALDPGPLGFAIAHGLQGLRPFFTVRFQLGSPVVTRPDDGGHGLRWATSRTASTSPPRTGITASSTRLLAGARRFGGRALRRPADRFGDRVR